MGVGFSQTGDNNACHTCGVRGAFPKPLRLLTEMVQATYISRPTYVSSRSLGYVSHHNRLIEGKKGL